MNNQGEEIENHYPSKILGFLDIEGEREALIQCSIKPLVWSVVERDSIVKLKLGMDFKISFVTVPIECLVNPLCVNPDIGGDRDIYFVVLPNVIGANSLGKELSSLTIYNYCVCVQENRNMRGHQQYTIASDLL